jgi:hypothetical protein
MNWSSSETLSVSRIGIGIRVTISLLQAAAAGGRT